MSVSLKFQKKSIRNMFVCLFICFQVYSDCCCNQASKHNWKQCAWKNINSGANNAVIRVSLICGASCCLSFHIEMRSNLVSLSFVCYLDHVKISYVEAYFNCFFQLKLPFLDIFTCTLEKIRKIVMEFLTYKLVNTYNF